MAADSGFIANRQCTTHHDVLDDLARLAPTAKVVANRVFVEDGALISSAGITAGIDMALHLITQVSGEHIGAHVAQVTVSFVRRMPGSPAESGLLSGRSHLHPAVHRVQNALTHDPAYAWTVSEMARVAHLTERHLGRIFQQQAGVSPRQYLESVRLAVAEEAERAGLSARKIEALCGLNPRQLRDAKTRATRQPKLIGAQT